MLPWAHPSPQPKRHLDRFSRFCTDDRREVRSTVMRPKNSVVFSTVEFHKVVLVGWNLTSLFSTNTAISETITR